MAFLAKHVVAGQQFSAVKGDIGLGAEGRLTEEERAKLEREERERLLALQEIERLRKKKHDKLEDEREKMRQSVRERYNIQKRKVADAGKHDLRCQQEAEMATNIAAMDPQNVVVETSRKQQQSQMLANAAAETDGSAFAAKLMSGNVSGVAAQVATKVHSLFKGRD